MPKKVYAIHEGNGVNKDIIARTMPLFVMSFFFYGPMVTLLAFIASLFAVATDWLAAKIRSRRYDKTENSSIAIALIIVLMMPASVRISIIVAAVLVGKEAFGGYGNYPFNPSAVGFCVAAVSWPEEILKYPAPQNWLLNKQPDWQHLFTLWNFDDKAFTHGSSYTLRIGGLPKIDDLSLVLGDYASAIGVTSCLVIAACAVFLIVKKRISIAASLGFLLTAAAIMYMFPRYLGVEWSAWPWDQALKRLEVLKFEMLTGAFPFAAVFLVNEPGTLPKNTISRTVYGILLGFTTVMFRYFGTFELGICFGFLLVNAVSGYFDRAVSKGIARAKGAARI